MIGTGDVRGWSVGLSVVVVWMALAAMCAFGALWTECAGAVEAKPFEIKRFEMQTLKSMSVVNVGITKFLLERAVDTSMQAGEHPWALSTTIEFESEKTQTGAIVPTRDPKDVVTDVPPGLLGDPQATPRCPRTVITEKSERCPADTQLGVVRLRWKDGHKEEIAPLVNVTPEAGQSAEFAIETNLKVTVLLTGHVVRSGSTYGLTVVSNNIALVQLVEAEVTFWGVPADPSHDAMRGMICEGFEGLEVCNFPGGVHSGAPPVAFLTMPANCTAGPETATVHADSWEEPGVYQQAHATLPGRTGCNLLQFNPAIEVSPDTMLADTPVALGVNLRVPQVENPEAPATPQIRTSILTFPEGLSISPGIVDGIQACNESGPEGINFEGPESEEIGLNGEPQLAPGHCPDASIVGTAEAETPLLASPVKGHVYLARPGCGNAALGQEPCTEQDALDGNLYQLYLELGGTGALADTGVNLKVRLKTEADPATGQLTTVAEDTPQLPFSELRIRLNGGPRAPLDNPAACGRATTTSDFKPWSAPGETPEGVFMPGTADAQPSSFFDVTGCGSPPGFKPGFLAGTVTPQAGQFSSFTVNLSRKDREQFVKGVQVHTPPGLLGMLSSVHLCGEVEAEAGTCGDGSKIGTTRVASGAGSHPFEIDGNVYLTGPYRGAPFGLSIVTHAEAGPFNLGLVVVRARINVDRHDSTLWVTTDETGPRAIPQIVFGVPLRLQRVTVNIDRPGFMFNPTNCGALQIAATLSGSQEASAGVASPFAVAGCKSLGFKPKFKVSTSGKTSRSRGASLDAKLSYPSGSLGSQANIARVKVNLPKQLPSRLTTLQQACPASTFEEDPAACPGGSVVGIVRSKTPLLPLELQGPVYFVSHGGEAFPSLIIVLEGEGVRVDLTGTTFISKQGITSSTFKTVPDVPVNSFELYLPEGRFSALAANGNLCKPASKLKMPTEFVAQNGAVIHQTTKIAVTGCKKAGARAAQEHLAKIKMTATGRAGK
jgi:hypothetical protein